MIAEADKAACNDLLLDAGERFGFPTMLVEEEPLAGQRIMLARDLGRVFYENADSSAPQHIMKRYSVEFVSIGGFVHGVRTLIRRGLTLPDSSAAKLATWQHFVIIGMYGQTEAAKKVKAYLLERERRARIDDKMVEATGQESFCCVMPSKRMA